MSDTKYQDALREAEKLAKRSDDDLFEQLGLRIQDVQNTGGYSRSMNYSADFAQIADDMLSTEDLKRVGRRWWKNLEPQLMNLVCTNNAEMKQITSGKTIPQIAASLATAGLVSTLAPPAWVIVATSILAAKIFESGLDAMCEVWRESLNAKTKGQEAPAAAIIE
jgi:hypothetical protein